MKKETIYFILFLAVIGAMIYYVITLIEKNQKAINASKS